MDRDKRPANLILSGGGIKGIAYIGMFEAAEEKGFNFRNIAGVSAGAMVGAFSGAGYKACELKDILYEFDFEKAKIQNVALQVPAIERFVDYYENSRYVGEKNFESFLKLGAVQTVSIDNSSGMDEKFSGYRGSFFKNVITYSKEGSLFDGDYIEEWIYKTLLRKGVKTFADLRGGKPDKSNPNGYKVRMTTVDANRGRIVVLPDDISFYGIDPDRLEVAKAVRMSSSVPFAFKPVEIYKKVGSKTKKHYLVDGGVLDNFPLWLIEGSRTPLIGCVLRGKNKIFSIMTPFNILKGLISAVHDFGIPHAKHYKNCFVVRINTGDVSFLDFNLSDKEKEYLINSGRRAALCTFNKMLYMNRIRRYGFIGVLRRILGFI